MVGWKKTAGNLKGMVEKTQKELMSQKPRGRCDRREPGYQRRMLREVLVDDFRSVVAGRKA